MHNKSTPVATQTCWRNIHLDGIFLDCFTIDPLVYNLPNRGVLSLDYVSYDVPTTAHADLFARLQTLRSEVFRIKRPPLWVMTGDTPPALLSEEATLQPGSKGGSGTGLFQSSISTILRHIACMLFSGKRTE